MPENIERRNMGKKNLDHFSICACHPCAGAMLIFSVSFQFYQMSPKGHAFIVAWAIYSIKFLLYSPMWTCYKPVAALTKGRYLTFPFSLTGSLRSVAE